MYGEILGALLTKDFGKEVSSGLKSNLKDCGEMIADDYKDNNNAYNTFMCIASMEKEDGYKSYKPVGSDSVTLKISLGMALLLFLVGLV